MSHVVVEVWLYGECAYYGNKINLEGVASLNVKLLAGSTIRDLLDYLLICPHEFDILLINGEPKAMPNRQLDPMQPLRDGDRLDFLDSQSVRSSQYRAARQWLLNNSMLSNPAKIRIASLLRE